MLCCGSLIFPGCRKGSVPSQDSNAGGGGLPGAVTHSPTQAPTYWGLGSLWRAETPKLNMLLEGLKMGI